MLPLYVDLNLRIDDQVEVYVMVVSWSFWEKNGTDLIC